VPGIWALGDCNGKGAFTHTAYNDFEIVAANLLDGDPRRVSDRIETYALFVDPPLGRAGLTETAARQAGPPHPRRQAPDDEGQARRREGDTRGFIKIVVDADSKQILGAAILGIGGDEVIHSVLDVMYARAPYTVLQRAMHIHPTVVGVSADGARGIEGGLRAAPFSGVSEAAGRPRRRGGWRSRPREERWAGPVRRRARGAPELVAAESSRDRAEHAADEAGRERMPRRADGRAGERPGNEAPDELRRGLAAAGRRPLVVDQLENRERPEDPGRGRCAEELQRCSLQIHPAEPSRPAHEGQPHERAQAGNHTDQEREEVQHRRPPNRAILHSDRPSASPRAEDRRPASEGQESTAAGWAGVSRSEPARALSSRDAASAALHR
jgi:hypothetical protein